MNHLRPFAVLTLAALLNACGNDSTPATNADSATTDAAQSSPTAPVAPVSPPPVDTATAPAATPAIAAVDGQKIYNNTCALCHAAGVAGAPMPGNKDEWAPRIAQGKDTLYKHAIEGYTGEKGMMPPRGGNPNLSDEQIHAAVDFMVQKSS